MLQRVAACYSVLQCVATCCRVLQYVAVRCMVWHYFAVCCSALQCQYCIVLQSVAEGCRALRAAECRRELQSDAECSRWCCRASWSVAVQCVAVQCVAVYCELLQYIVAVC